MSQPQPPKPAKLVIGLFLQDRTLWPEMAGHLQTAFGTIDMISPWFAFDYTEYYAPEMGSPLFRRLLVFKKLIEQEDLSGIKCRTNALELIYATQGRRRVNLDPGYLLLERFVLASGKNFTHRIYIGQGIYADLTLMFQKGAFQTLPWTYPDYAAIEMRRFLTQARQKYAVDLADLKK